jgi:tagaturonate reductase
MQLSKQTIEKIKPQPGLIIPGVQLFDLPEKVLQFGTGVLLRGLPDYFIDKANRKGIFNGRIVLVKSTAQGGTNAFASQDNLYTVCVRGIEDGKKVDEMIVNSSISRVLSAKDEWQTILQCAHNPAMEVIISNTTEVGITLMKDDITAAPPHSFPGKLLSFLYERYKAFDGDHEKGLVIIPTELIPDNGIKLRAIVAELADMNKMEAAFTDWLFQANHFCNSLVDRIVPGKLAEQDLRDTEKKLGYKDELMILAESFRLWAIESSEPKVKKILSFQKSDEGVIIAPDIEKFRELKLRLLNGTHTFSCGLAYLAGFRSVKEAMSNPLFSNFITGLALQEIAEAICDDNISIAEARDFARKVLDRFRNPFLDHQWLAICMQYSSKMKLRNIPLLLKHYQITKHPPVNMALGFAAYLLFMKNRPDGEKFTGHWEGSDYTVQDDHAAYFAEKWEQEDPDQLVESVINDKNFWEADLSSCCGLTTAIQLNLQSLLTNGVMATLEEMQLNKTTV